MNHWQILGIDPTSDLAELKKAYRIALKAHHPEDDPEGFKQVRAAYEALLSKLSTPQPISIDLSSLEASQPINNATESISSESYTAYLQQMNDPASRFNMAQWRAWEEQLRWQTIDVQSQVSQQVREDILARPWLPGELIALLWEACDWDELYSGSQEELELANYLKRRSAIQSGSDFVALSQLPDSAQKAVFQFINPIIRALDNGEIRVLHYWLLQSTCVPWCDDDAFNVLILKACNAIQWYPPIIESWLPTLVTDERLERYTTEQLEVLGTAALYMRNIDIIIDVCTNLINKQSYGLAADLLYQTALSAQNNDLTLLTGYLLQQWTPLPTAHWRCLYQINPLHNEEPSAVLPQSWLYRQLTERTDNDFRHYLDFKDHTDFIGVVTQSLWAEKYGSLVWQRTQLAELQALSEHVSAFEQLIAYLAFCWCEQSVIRQESLSTSLAEKLYRYETDELLSSPLLTQEELDALTAEQWGECLMRHPLIPDHWMEQLLAGNCIDIPTLNDLNLTPRWAYETLYYRISETRHQLSSVYLSKPFSGVFRWLLVYHSSCDEQIGISGQECLKQLAALPEEQQTGPLGELANSFSYQGVERVAYLGEQVSNSSQFLMKLLVENTLLQQQREHDIQALQELAAQHRPEAYAMLALRYRYSQLELAIFYYNLLRINVTNTPIYSFLLTTLNNCLVSEANKKEWIKETYDLGEYNAYALYLNEDMTHIPQIDEIGNRIPNDDAKRFHHPIGYLLSTLIHGLPEQGYSLAPLFNLRKQTSESYSEEEQQAINLGIGLVNQRLEERFTNEVKEKRLKKFGRSSLLATCGPFTLLWFGLFDATLANQPLFSTANLVSILMMTFAQLGLTIKICRAMPLKSEKRLYQITVWPLYLLAMGFGSSWIAGLTCVIHFGQTWRIRSAYANQRWNNRIINKGKIDINSLLKIPFIKVEK